MTKYDQRGTKGMTINTTIPQIHQLKLSATNASKEMIRPQLTKFSRLLKKTVNKSPTDG